MWLPLWDLFSFQRKTLAILEAQNLLILKVYATNSLRYRKYDVITKRACFNVMND
jgi:hypothetical protein